MNVTRRRVRGKKEAVYNKELLRVLSAKIVCVCIYSINIYMEICYLFLLCELLMDQIILL